MRTLIVLAGLVACAPGPTPTEPIEPAAPSPLAEQAMKATVGEKGDADSPLVEGWTDFGGAFQSAMTVPAAAVLAAPADYVDQTVRVSGRVADVCTKKGCWMVLEDDGKTMRVTMKDYGFFVSKQGKGGQCELEGTVVAREVDPERQAHLAAESTEPAPAVDGAVSYELVASAVRMRRGGV